MGDLNDSLTAQLEEIYSIHSIYYPVRISSYGGVSSDFFPSQCMSETYYNELLEKTKHGTSVKINEGSIKGSVRSELIRFCFKISPSFSLEGSNVKFALINVTFPKSYPSKSPYISVKMTFPMSTYDKRRFTYKLLQIMKNSTDKSPIFEVSLFVNEIMSKLLSNDHDNLWEEVTTREDDSRSLRSDQLKDTSDQSVEDEILTQDEDVVLTQDEDDPLDILDQDEDSFEQPEIDYPTFPIWNVQSIVQSPMWYQHLRKNEGVVEGEKLTKNVLKSSAPKLKLPTRIIEDDFTPQNSINSKETDDQLKSLLNIGLYFTHETVKNINNIRRLLLEFVGETYYRYERDFLENDHLYDTNSISLCSVRHVLDQNLYFIKIFHIPCLCPYINLSSVDVRSILQSFRVRRKLILNEIMSKVSQLSRLEHNSICRYYQSWIEKKLNQSEVDHVLKLCDEILNIGSYSTLFKPGSMDEKMILLFKYASELGENFVYELVTDRDLYIQIQNFNCNSLRYHIENSSLHKDEKLIWRFIRHLLDVMAYLHQNNVYHQCLSVDNIFVHKDEYGTGLKVSEFGITHLARKFLTCKNECNRKSCDCQEYRKCIKKHLYQSHPSNYGLMPVLPNTQIMERLNSSTYKGLGINRVLYNKVYSLPPSVLTRSISPSYQGGYEGFQGLNGTNPQRLWSPLSSRSLSLKESQSDNDENIDPFMAVQEDMFALGLIIFRMWHPPLDEKSIHELLVKVVSTKTFPDYFIKTTPPIIITTLTRLLSRDLRPSASELLTETLVPPVMDIYMYKQYLRKLENPMTEESLDALKFLLSRDWKSDVSKYRHNYCLETLTHCSYVTDSLERFMRTRGVIIRPPLPLQIKTHETNDSLLCIDGTNTVFAVGGSIRQSLLRSFELYSGDDSGIGVKQFSVGDVYDEEKCVTNAVFSITIKLENDQNMFKSVAKKGVDYRTLDDNCILMVSTQVDLIIISIESLMSLNLRFEMFLTITFQPLIIDFLSIVLDTSIEVASIIFGKLQSTDINEYTFKVLLEENLIEKKEDFKNLVEVLSNRFGLIAGLKRLHFQVLNSQIPKQYQKDFIFMYQEINKMCPDDLGSFDSQFSESSKIKEKNNEEGTQKDYLIFERYYRRMIYMLEMSKMLQSLNLESYCFIEFVLGSYYTEICDYCVNFPFFLCFMSDGIRNLVMTGGCYGTNTCFLEESNLSKILHFDIQYFLDELIKLSIKDTQKIEGYNITPTKSDHVDVIITCQTLKLLPAATSIANKLIDAGLSVECRAIPLIRTSDFNIRLRMVESIKARVHLQKQTNISSEEGQTEKNPQESNEKNLNEDDQDDKSHYNILYHVEPINGSFGHSRKIDNEVALVHFIIGQLT